MQTRVPDLAACHKYSLCRLENHQIFEDNLARGQHGCLLDWPKSGKYWDEFELEARCTSNHF